MSRTARSWVGRILFISGLVLMLVAPLLLVKSTYATPGVLPPATPLSLATSSKDAYAKFQTINYSAVTSKPGTLSYIILTIPTGATVSSPRSSSGTVSAYKTGQIIWRPAKPIVVKAGARLSIPVTGINYNQAGTTNMWLVASDARGEVLAYATSSIALSNNAQGCQPTGNNYIKTENAKPGSPKTAWQIDSAKFSPSLFAGYANAESYKCGDMAYLKVDSQSSPFATAKVYRMGYYGGAGAREVWSTSDYFLTGKQSPVKVVNQTTPKIQNMADASHWNYNLGIRIDGRFTPGTYLAKLTDRVGHETYVPFTVRDDSGVKHDYLLQQATTTWQAYNKYGNYSFYSPSDAKVSSSHLSFNRPYSEADGKGSGQFLQLENGMVYFMEKQGYDVAYWTDTDLQNRPTELSSRTKVLVLPAHDEYYSMTMRGALVDNINKKGVHLVSFGANQVHRVITYQSANRVFEVRGKSGGTYSPTTFRSMGPAYSEQNILGAQYGCASHGNIITNKSWVWAGIGPNVTIKGFANGEADYVNKFDNLNKYTVPVPVGTKVLASATLDRCRVSFEPLRMDIVARTTSAGMRVFGGSSFAYGCFINKSCPTSWLQGASTTKPPATPAYNKLVVSDADSLRAGIVAGNVLDWALTGIEPKQ